MPQQQENNRVNTDYNISQQIQQARDLVGVANVSNQNSTSSGVCQLALVNNSINLSFQSSINTID